MILALDEKQYLADIKMAYSAGWNDYRLNEKTDIRQYAFEMLQDIKGTQQPDTSMHEMD